jgi:hypothetical protein
MAGEYRVLKALLTYQEQHYSRGCLWRQEIDSTGSVSGRTVADTARRPQKAYPPVC